MYLLIVLLFYNVFTVPLLLFDACSKSNITTLTNYLPLIQDQVSK